MKVLLVYPECPDTFWSFKYALKFSSKKALDSPLGIITVAAMLPTEWEKRVIDMNVTRLKDKDIEWADYIFISAMVAQHKSVREVVNRCKILNKSVIAGGPLFTTGYEELGFRDIDHIVLNEAEITLPLLLKDISNGCPKHVYRTDQKADITKTATPSFSLLDLSKYVSVTVQYSRGCPFDCEFCNILVLDGRKPRTKTKDQLLAELTAIYSLGYRGSVFIVDDNFIGNKFKLKADILPAIIDWQKENKHPFTFHTEASINLADDEDLMELMADAGFNNVFVGIESPNEESLNECSKFTNKNRDLVASVKKLQNHGFQVMGGFIVGFDSDPFSIFKRQIDFIQESGIVTAMIGILYAPPQTRLWHRLKKANRLLPGCNGDNTDGTTNFIPIMDFEVLINGYKQILHEIYSPKKYYERIRTFLKEYRQSQNGAGGFEHRAYAIDTLARATFALGFKSKGAWHYWMLILSSIVKHPRLIELPLALAVQGLHFRKVYNKVRHIQITDELLVKQKYILKGEPI